MKAFAIALALIFLAGVTGTASTVVIYSAIWQEPTDLYLKIAGVLAGHLFFCSGYVVIHESFIEDAVKSVILAILGACTIPLWPLVGLTEILRALFAFAASQSYSWTTRG
jgi:hypothetical protein